jgi:hypothetical protein
MENAKQGLPGFGILCEQGAETQEIQATRIMAGAVSLFAKNGTRALNRFVSGRFPMATEMI